MIFIGIDNSKSYLKGDYTTNWSRVFEICEKTQSFLEQVSINEKSKLNRDYIINFFKTFQESINNAKVDPNEPKVLERGYIIPVFVANLILDLNLIFSKIKKDDSVFIEYLNDSDSKLKEETLRYDIQQNPVSLGDIDEVLKLLRVFLIKFYADLEFWNENQITNSYFFSSILSKIQKQSKKDKMVVIVFSDYFYEDSVDFANFVSEVNKTKSKFIMLEVGYINSNLWKKISLEVQNKEQFKSIFIIDLFKENVIKKKLL